MIRSEVIEHFRAECPEITSRVVTDSLLYKWCKVGDKQFCAATRCIVDQDGKDITTTADDIYYDLTSQIPKFYDIDDWPGSGVLYEGKKLTKTTMSELDVEFSGWRDWDSGTPKKWYRRGKYVYLDRKIDTTGNTIRVYAVLVSDDWDSDVAPFNQLTYLEPFHEGMVKYLIQRAKAKVGKPEEAKQAMLEYSAFVEWTKKQLGGNKFGPIHYQRSMRRPNR